ncbi:hypothetical protein CK203_036417 [Vitis vinifera]|uniref:Uncharacterized protein n=1 Tax=Vitis vinifera TaxID=29760 RepID=A0A438HYZ1_VITVI|nr:hypothetical protein CK203_036417 [Vitis vinifera]
MEISLLRHLGSIWIMKGMRKGRHVSRVANVKEDALEALYERRLKKKAAEKQKEESALQVDPVDALPVKTLDGELYYRTAPKKPKDSENAADKYEADGRMEMKV